ncbi:MAG: malate dehydrogenase [Chloroflexi bacterium]|nr:malate dehydrogenase [Chloroflexota bacterium]
MASSAPVRVAVSGASGNVSYSLLFRIAAGDLLGRETPIELRLLDIEPAMKALDGVVMELEDSAFPLLRNIVSTTDPRVAFDGASWVLLVGSVPRREGMERGDLLKINGGIFGPYGKALATAAASEVRILVVGNPCNTNCLIARSNGRDIPDDRWFAMVRLDQNRAKAQLARRANVPVSQVRHMAIWGNHSATQYPDFQNATIAGKPAEQVIEDQEWLRGDFIKTIQQRGAAIIAARGQSSAGSAAAAIIDSVVSIHTPTADGDCASLAVTSHGEYGVPEGLQFGFPVKSTGSSWQVIQGLRHDDFAKEKIRVTTEELLSEREEIKDLL